MPRGQQRFDRFHRQGSTLVTAPGKPGAAERGAKKCRKSLKAGVALEHCCVSLGRSSKEDEGRRCHHLCSLICIEISIEMALLISKQQRHFDAHVKSGAERDRASASFWASVSGWLRGTGRRYGFGRRGNRLGGPESGHGPRACLAARGWSGQLARESPA